MTDAITVGRGSRQFSSPSQFKYLGHSWVSGGGTRAIIIGTWLGGHRGWHSSQRLSGGCGEPMFARWAHGRSVCFHPSGQSFPKELSGTFLLFWGQPHREVALDVSIIVEGSGIAGSFNHGCPFGPLGTPGGSGKIRA